MARVRVLQHFQPVADDDAEVMGLGLGATWASGRVPKLRTQEMRVSKTTNSTKLGSAVLALACFAVSAQ